MCKLVLPTAALFLTLGAQAQVISTLPAAASVNGADMIPASQGVTTRRITPAQIAEYERTLPQALTNKTLTAPVINSPTGIVKGDVGLGNVDNTSDATKNAATATLTGKTISGASNTLSDIGNSSLTNSAITINGSSTSLGGSYSLTSPTVIGLWTGTCDGTTFLRGDGACAAAGGGSGANPSASVGLTAVNGVATTFLRSDGAPALNQSIAPTWTGVHTWSSAEPRVLYNESDQASNEKLWDWDVQAKVMCLRTRTDADAAGVNAFCATRGSGTALSSISIPNATLNLGASSGTATSINVAGNSSSAVTIGTAGAGVFQASAFRLILTGTTFGNSLYLKGTNQIALTTASTDRLVIDSAGAVSVGTGISTEQAKVGGVVYTNTTTVGNVAATETDAFAHNVVASTLGVDGQSLRLESAGTFAGTANTDKRVKVKYGATTIFDSGALAITSAASWTLRCSIIRTGAATQKTMCSFNTSSSVLPATASYATAAETLSGAVTLKLTLNGTSANDTVGEFYKEEWLPFD